MSTDFILTDFDTSNYKLIWSPDNERAAIRDGNRSVIIRTNECKINFGFKDSGKNLTMMIIEGTSNAFIGIFNKINLTLQELAPEHPISGFIKHNETENSIAVLAKIPIDEKRRVLIDVYREDGKQINDRGKPTLTIEDLRNKYRLHPGTARSTIQISGLSLFQGNYYVNIFVLDFTICSRPINEGDVVDIRDWL